MLNENSRGPALIAEPRLNFFNPDSRAQCHLLLAERREPSGDGC